MNLRGPLDIDGSKNQFFLHSHHMERYWFYMFVKQPQPTKIVKISVFFVFSKKSKIAILVSDSAHKSLLIILLIFFD